MVVRESGLHIDGLGTIPPDYVVLKPGSQEYQHGRPCTSRMTTLLLSTSL